MHIHCLFLYFLNGKLHGFIKSKRGLRQGDPLSPYIFAFAMDYLSRIIKLNTANHSFNFDPKCEKIGFTHLAFADDIMLFTRGDEEPFNILFNSLQQFGACLGLEINLAKSNLFVAGVSNADILIM